jgi:hypothetical protein
MTGPLDVHDPAPDARFAMPAGDVYRFLVRAEGQPAWTSAVLRVSDRFITSRLVLRGQELRWGLEFERCRFEVAPDLAVVRTLDLVFTGCWLPGLDAPNLVTAGAVTFERCTVDGPVDLTDASVGGTLTLRDTSLHNPGGEALTAPRVSIGGALVGDGLTATGTLSLPAARIQGTLSLRGARLVTPGGDALSAEHAQVLGPVDLTDGFAADGAVRLDDITAEGPVLMADATVTVADGEAITLGGARVNGSAVLTGTTTDGAVTLAGAVLTSDADLRGCRIGGALDVTSASIGRDLLCTTGDRPFAAAVLRAPRAQVGRQANLDGAELTHAGGVSVDLADLRAQDLVLTLAGPVPGRVVLRKARCESVTDDTDLWEAAGGLDVTEFTYEAFGVPIDPLDTAWVRTRLRLLRRALAGSYQPSPYDQLITVLRTAGMENLATIAQIEKQRARYKALADAKRLSGPVIRLASNVLRVGFGYGYRISLALGWLAALWVFGAVWFAVRPALPPINPGEQVPWNPALYTLDLLVPLVDLGNKNRWLATGASRGIAVTLTVMGWILATTIAAELARLLRRPS